MVEIHGYWICGEDENGTNKRRKVFVKTLAHADRILKQNTHINGQRIRCQHPEHDIIDTSELGFCEVKNKYLGKEVYVTRSLATCTECVTSCGDCGFFKPLQPQLMVCPMCGYLACRHIKQTLNAHYGDARCQTVIRASETHIFCPKCWGVHDSVTRKIIRYKDTIQLQIKMKPVDRTQEDYDPAYDPDANGVR